MKSTIKLRLRQIISLMLIMVWMIIVFIFSNQPGDESAHTSGYVTDKICNTISQFIEISEESRQNISSVINVIVRKMAHFSIYMLGGMLLMNFASTYKNIKEKKQIIYSILIGIIYAGTDEIHQYFIEGRSCMITDVFIDTLGIITGICAFLILLKIYKRVKNVKGD